MLSLLITLDCVRDDHVGTGLTPGLDAMDREWTSFTEAFAQSQNTLSSHLSMLTSNYLFQHGVYSNYVQKALPAHALPTRLAGKGWECRAFTSVDFLALLLGNQVGEHDSRFPAGTNLSFGARIRRKLGGRRASAEKTLKAALKWLGSTRSKDVFLWIHLFDAHMVYEAPKRILDKHVSHQKAGSSVKEQLARKDWFSPEFPEYAWHVPLEHFPQRYRAAVAYLDACLGDFIGALKAKGWWEDAFVAVTADHGECLLGDYYVYCAHKKLFDITVKVPLKVRFPKGEHAGEKVDAIVQHVDLAPTMASLAGFEEPLYAGRDLRKIASGRDPGHATAFSEHVDNFMRCLRDKNFIYVEQVPGSANKWGLKMEAGNLFKRDSSPAGSDGGPETARLKAAMEGVLSSRPEIAKAWGGGTEAEAEVAERLKDLGYM
jgi:arylsulfatase A-like enzyme